MPLRLGIAIKELVLQKSCVRLHFVTLSKEPSQRVFTTNLPQKQGTDASGRMCAADWFIRWGGLSPLVLTKKKTAKEAPAVYLSSTLSYKVLFQLLINITSCCHWQSLHSGRWICPWSQDEGLSLFLQLSPAFTRATVSKDSVRWCQQWQQHARTRLWESRGQWSTASSSSILTPSNNALAKNFLSHDGVANMVDQLREPCPFGSIQPT